MSQGTSPSGVTRPTTAPTSTRRAVLNTMKGSAGNLVEWYDVYVYTVFASYFEAQFFDEAFGRSLAHVQAEVFHPLLQQAARDPLSQESACAGDQDLHGCLPMSATMASIILHTRRMCACGMGSTPRSSLTAS